MGRLSTGRLLLTCGVVGPPLFVAVFLVDGSTRPGFDPWRHWVSHLSLGERGWIGVVNLIVFGLLMLGFSEGLRRVLPPGRGSVWGPRLTSVLGLALILAGVFPVDPGLGYPPGVASGQSAGGTIHDLAGALFFGSMTAVCFVFARRFVGDPHWKGWARSSIVTGTVVTASFVACSMLVSLDYSGIVPGAPSGLFERVSVVTGGTWISLFSVRLLRMKESRRTAQTSVPA